MEIQCPKCKHPVTIDVSKAIDELGEVYKCPNCGWKIRFVEK